MNNLNLIFNKLYYDRLGKKDFDGFVKNKNNEIFSSVFNHDIDYQKSEIANAEFLVKTTYPGLLIGHSGYHGSGKSEDDISAGIDLDFVTGQPYIKSTSIKGTFRSCFRHRQAAVLEIIKNIAGKEFSKEEFDLLEEELFCGTDVFLDAVVYDGDEYGRLVGKDYFSPQKNELENPLPLFVIKVLPEVRFEFRFILTDGHLSKEEKLQLFSELVLVFGMGGRTAVGYGRMVKCETEISKKKRYGEMLSDGKRQELVICPKCGKKNYKYKFDTEYRYVTDIVNSNWKKGICCIPDCGGELK